MLKKTAHFSLLTQAKNQPGTGIYPIAFITGRQ